MKYVLALFFFPLLILNCNSHPTENESDGHVLFYTDKTTYSVSDTLNLIVQNNSGTTLIIGLRCAEMLEMYYQQKENDIWSANLLFDYMTLRCLTMMDSVKINSQFRQSVPASIFKSTGTFRLILNDEIISSVFDIK